MFRITAESCRRFTLAEILIMGAMNNVERMRWQTLAVEDRTRGEIWHGSEQLPRKES